ncbi:MAG: spherulation-specific family 4 protein [Streptosporangiaceae bacterium]
MRLRLHADPARPATPLLVIPAYFQPGGAPGAWESMAASAPRIRAVILNVANGPGRAPSSPHRGPLGLLRDAGVLVLGYVDTNYGGRPAGCVFADIDRYRRWYDVGGICFDRAPAGPRHVDHYAMLAGGARERGAGYVFFNHGAHPVPDYADHADLLGTFEGPWHAYRTLAVPRWTRTRDAAKFYHVVHSVPPSQLAPVLRLATRRHAGCAYVTDRDGPNPYDRLPAGLLPRAAPGARSEGR